MFELVRWIGCAVLMLLPGAWVSFSQALPGFSFAVRMAYAVVLSPLLLAVQFYAIRLLGPSFETTAVLLVLLNLPAAYLVLRALPRQFPSQTTLAAWAVALVVPLACLAPQLLHTQARVYSAHAWMHADIVYMIANGELVLEDPGLAGVRLDYYWAGHVYQALLSYVLDSAPVDSYVWTNVLFLIACYGFVAGVTAELGGGRLAQVGAIAWLSFGVNFLGYTAGQLFRSQTYGDPRYTPWLLYFLFFHPITIAVASFAGVAYLLVRRRPWPRTPVAMVLVGLLLCTVGILYPILLPAAAVLIAARVLTSTLTDSALGTSRWQLRESVGLILVLASVLVVSALHIHFVTRDRIGAPIVLHSIPTAWRFALTTGIVTFPLLIGFGVAVRRGWRERREATLVLACGGFASCAAYVLMEIPPGAQYKFMFTAAICLAPFPSLALEPVLERLGRMALPALGLVSLMLAAPFAHSLYTSWPWGYRQWGFVYPARPLTITDSFDLRLASSEPLAGLFDAIRNSTPTNSVLIVDGGELNVPTLTRRRLYAPVYHEKAHPGINLHTDTLLTATRGYDRRILQERRKQITALLDDSAPGRAAALAQVLAVNRPLVLVVDTTRHRELDEWLAHEKATAIYRNDGASVWLVLPPENGKRE